LGDRYVLERTMTKQCEPILYLPDSYGIYLPQNFARRWVHVGIIPGVDQETWDILLAGPDHKDYSEAWSEVLESIVVINHTAYRLYQDGDLWLVPEGMTWDEEKDWWVWP
jgi:hypothetical protein